MWRLSSGFSCNYYCYYYYLPLLKRQPIFEGSLQIRPCPQGLTALHHLLCLCVQKVGNAVINRFREWSERPQAFELLGQAVQQMFKVLDAYSDKVNIFIIALDSLRKATY